MEGYVISNNNSYGQSVYRVRRNQHNNSTKAEIQIAILALPICTSGQKVVRLKKAINKFRNINENII